MNDIILKAGKERSLLRRHPWIYATAVLRHTGQPQRGETVCVRDEKGAFLAWGAYSPDSQIRVRCWSFKSDDQIDPAWFERRLRSAWERRQSLLSRTNGIRVVFGEADGLPGLVVDAYADQLVVQLLSAGVDYWREVIADALVNVTGIKHVYERSDAAVRQREGLASVTGVLRGRNDFSGLHITEDGVRYQIDIEHGHKTGFYLDQRESRLKVTELAQRLGSEATVLNCFSYTGGFSLAALKGGAASAISVDSSADALAMAKNNAELNGFSSDRFICRVAKVADALRDYIATGTQFDMVVLDPPKFAPSAHHVDAAARAYKDINLKGMKLVKPGGYLLTFSCSGAITVDLFQKIIAGAVVDAKQDFVLLERLAAGEDHPMSMTHPEGEYLKGLLLQKIE